MTTLERAIVLKNTLTRAQNRARVVAMRLSFGRGNAKLHKGIYTFSLPSGWTCPHASTCLSKADKVTGKITDGPLTTVRCFSASQEALHTNVRVSRWRNFDALRQAKSMDKMAKLIFKSIPRKAKIIRIHVGGDFFSADYFDAWVVVAWTRPDVLFYAYTKSLPYWLAAKDRLPHNLKLTASIGGKRDDIIALHKLKSATIVFSSYQARKLGLKVDHDDSLAYGQDKSFALLIHGTQPAKSLAAKAWQRVKSTVGGYSRKNQPKEGA